MVFGLADIALMIYSIANGQSYSSSFNIFAVAAGIFLFRGNLGAVRLVTWFSAFMLTAFIGALFFIFPFIQPLGLLLARIKLNPIDAVVSCLIALIVLALLGWTYRQLRSAPVLGALKEGGRSAATPKIAFGSGLALVAMLALAIHMTLNGTAGARAIELARQKLGPTYHYATQSIQWSGGHTKAVVVAYDNNEIKHVTVKWSE